MDTNIKLGKNPLYTPHGRVFAIGDVHGEAKKLKMLWAKIKQILKPKDHVVFVGDYVDVGPNTPETLKYLQIIKNEHPNTFFIMGNHEEMMLHAMKGVFDWWYANKGGKTVVQFEKFGVDDPTDIKDWLIKENITFLDELITYYETETLLITHAPITPRLAHWGLEEGVLEQLREEIRWRFAQHEKQEVEKVLNKLFICGHQNGYGRLKEPRIYLEVNRVFLDAGAGYYFDAPLACVVVHPQDQIKAILSEGKIRS
jgi:serine/threonine protein phosphatase 1